jgi:hypothetical protein
MANTSSTIRIVIDGVTEGLRGAATQSAADLLRLKRAADDTDKSTSKLGRTATLTGKAFLGLGSAGGAVSTLTGLATSAVTASGALLVLPGAALGGAAAITTLKLAFSGFGDAVSAGDPKEFAEATKDMGKEAVNTAKAVRDLKTPLIELKKEVQNRFFTGLAADTKALGGTYFPVLGRQLPGIAGGFGAMAKEAVRALMTPDSVRAVNTTLGQTKIVTEDLKPALGNVVAGILQLGESGSKEFNLFGLSIASATERFKVWATEANKSGQIAQLIRNGREEFAKWGDLFSNVGGIVRTIFRGIATDQTDFVGNMVKATAAVGAFLNSTAGQNGLKAFGDLLQTTAGITRDVFLQSLLAVAPVIAASGPAIQEFATIIGGTLVAAIQVVGPPLQSLGQFLADNVGVVQVLGPLILGLVVAFKGLSILGSLVLPLAATVIAMNAVGLATGRLTLALRILSLAAGPIGIILTGATIALGIFAAANSGSGDSVQQNQQAIDELKGTLDQFTGSVTDATRKQIANDIVTRQLADGTGTLADGVKRAGIDILDFTAAASGSQEQLQKVNRTLLDNATAFIQNDANLGRWKQTIQDAHVPVETLALAVIGNEEAVKSLSDTYGINEGVARNLVDALRAQAGELYDVGSALGAYNAQLSEAQKQTKEAADANRDYTNTLGALKDGLSALVTGGAPLPAMVAGFQELSRAADDSAASTGKAAAQLGGVEAGARKAAQSMQESRDSFVQAAVAAGNTEQAANLLADEIGLIPAVADIAFRTNANETTTDLLALNVQISRVPPGKAVKIDALTDDAIKRLQDLGFTVQKLPNGQFEVTADTKKAKQGLADIVSEVGRSVGTITVDANTKPADTKIKGQVAFADGSTGTMKLDANPNPATGKIQGTVAYGNGQTATITVDGNRDPATGKINATITYANGSTGTVQVQANTSSAQAAIDRLKITTYSAHYVDVYTRDHTGGFVSNGAGGRLNAMGNLLMPMARGGLLSGRVATVVPPNTWRVIGDNMTVPEAFIPLNGSRRSLSILQEAAAMMNRSVVPFASGGIAAPTPGAITGQTLPEVRVFIGDTELTGMIRTEIVRAERATVRRARTGSGVTF